MLTPYSDVLQLLHLFAGEESEEGDSVCYEATTSSILRMGQFLDGIDHYDTPCHR